MDKNDLPIVLDSETLDLVVSAKLGDKNALNNLFARYQSRILRIVRLRLSSELRHRLRLQSMDIVQEVFLYALQHLKDFEPKSKGHFLNWLSKRVEHYILDRLDYVSRVKRKAPGGEISVDEKKGSNNETYQEQLQIADNRPTPSQSAIIKQREQLIDSALRLLKPEQRELITHRDLEELTFKEIGEIYNKSKDAVRKQYCRAFKKLIELSEEKLRPLIAEETYRYYKE
jgi:RNA polymerase sigma-70 factor (subfamily 1)